MPEQAGDVLGVGSRLAEGPAPELVQTAFTREVAEQLPLFEGISLADLAHTVMLMENRVMPLAAGRELLAALLALHVSPIDFVPDPALGDLYTNREAWLAARTSTVGWLGAGRARREATTTAYQLVLRRRLLRFSAALQQAGLALLDQAEAHQASLMADYTYLQPAQPTVFGHYLLTFVYPLLRDLERLKSLYGRTNLSPAGCGSVNGSRLPQDRQRLAQLLGFEGLVTHARDAMWQPDGPIETLAVMVAALVNLDRLAEDLQIFATVEFNLIDLADGHARASVIMPQKKNPYALSYIRAVTNDLTGQLTAAATWGRTPSGQVDNRIGAYGSVPRALESGTGAVRLMAGVIGGMRFNTTLAAQRLAASFASATDLAEMITLETGLDFRSAHRVVGRLVREALAAGRAAKDLTSHDVDAAAQMVLERPLGLSEEVLTQAFDLEASLAARQQAGGAAPAPLAAMLAECRASLSQTARWHEQAETTITQAETALLDVARQQATAA